MVFFLSLNNVIIQSQRYQLFSQVSDVAHGPHVWSLSSHSRIFHSYGAHVRMRCDLLHHCDCHPEFGNRRSIPQHINLDWYLIIFSLIDCPTYTDVRNALLHCISSLRIQQPICIEYYLVETVYCLLSKTLFYLIIFMNIL